MITVRCPARICCNTKVKSIPGVGYEIDVYSHPQLDLIPHKISRIQQLHTVGQRELRSGRDEAPLIIK